MEQTLTQLIDYLTAERYLIPSDGQFPLLSVSTEGVQVLLGERKVFRKEDQKVRKVAVDDALFERLRELRMDMAQEAGVPPYVVFSDSTLKEMCEKLPQTTIQLLQIKGVGQNKLDKYGTAFLEVIKEYQETKK